MTSPDSVGQSGPGDLLTVGGEAVASNGDRLGLTWSLRPATVSGGIDPTAISLTLDGDDALISAYSLVGSLPNGARVMTMRVPPSGLYVVGYVGTQAQTNVQVMRYIPDALSPNDVSSTSYADVTGASLSFTKWANATRLHIDLKASGQATTAGAVYLGALGVAIGGTDYDVSRYFFNSTTDHQAFSGDTTISGVVAGAYTIQVRGLVGTAAKVWRIDRNDLVTMTVTELL